MVDWEDPVFHEWHPDVPERLARRLTELYDELTAGRSPLGRSVYYEQMHVLLATAAIACSRNAIDEAGAAGPRFVAVIRQALAEGCQESDVALSAGLDLMTIGQIKRQVTGSAAG